MNRKLLMGGLAGAAAIALAVGGTTYSAWSDFGNITGNEAGSGHLVLNVNKDTSTSVESFRLAPGQNNSRDFFLASNDGQSVPKGELSATLTHLVNTEDGCTSNSEHAAENPLSSASGNYDADTACGDNSPGNNNGEFSHEALIELKSFAPTGGVCDYAAVTSTPVTYLVPMDSVVGQKYDIATLTPGQSICLRAYIYLPTTADDKVQGDSVSFDFHFDLAQVTP